MTDAATSAASRSTAPSAAHAAAPAATGLAARLAEPRVLLAPGVHDALSALIAAQSGFEALYLSGATVAYTQLGRSDVGLTTASETADVLARITERVDTPVIVDADTGYGNALNVQRTVRAFERAGAAMIQLEDQTFPKRCGHLDGKRLIGTQEMCGKIKAAVDARQSPHTLILARTDAVAIDGLAAAFERAEAYRAAGADALFIEALPTLDDMAAACRRFAAHTPLLANMVEGGKSPLADTATLGRLGFRLVIFPGGTVRHLAAQMQRYYRSLLAHGNTAPLRPEMLDFDGLNALIGTPELMARARGYDA